MQPRPSFDGSLLIPIAIIVISILGLRWVFSTTELGSLFIRPTAIPSSFSPLETKTRTPSPAPARSAPLARDDVLPSATEAAGPTIDPGTPTETLPPTNTLTATPPTPSTTPTPAGIQPLRAGKYDDTDPNIEYDMYWTALKNASTARSYQGTIHASSYAGSEASFRFTGKGFQLGYKRGKSFGTVTVLIDGQPYNFSEQSFDLVWRSPKLPVGDHFVQIVHQSGESVNLDYILILE